MENTLTIILLIFALIFLFLLFFYLQSLNRSGKNSPSFEFPLNDLEEKEVNPDINTDNWDLHKLRLEKFRRSQYKGLTFFVSSENRIYYLSKEGDKVYC